MQIIRKQAIIPFAEVFSKIISFVNILLLMKVLLMTEYADYSYIVAIVLWASVLMDGGINNLVFNKSLKNDLQGINTLFSARFVISVIIILLLAFFFFYRKPEIALSALLYSIIIYISSSSAFIKMLSRGKGYYKVDLTVILTEPILRLVLFLIALIAFKNLKWELWIIMVIYLIAGLLSFSINYIVLTKHIRLKIYLNKIKHIFKNVQDTLVVSKFYLLYYLMYIGISRVDVIFIERYASKIDLALYSSSYTLFAVIQLFFFSLITSQFRNIHKTQKKSIFYIIVALIFVVIVTLLVSSFVYSVLFPADYLEGSTVLNYMIFALIPSVIVFYFITKLNYENKTFENFIILLLPLAFKILIYSLARSSEIDFYRKVYPFIEYLILASYLFYFLYINKRRQTSNE